MYPRTNYEMTEKDMKELMDAMKPVPMIMLQCGNPPSQQENANSAWKKLGNKMGFDHMTVKPSSGGARFFTAVPSETKENKEARIKKETSEKRKNDITDIDSKIAALEYQKQELITDMQSDSE